MRNVSQDEFRGGDNGILIAQVEDAFWLLDGEDYLGAMLSAEKPYPMPVHCMRFLSLWELASHLPEGVDISVLWSIHPAIVERLKRNDEIVIHTLPKANEQAPVERITDGE